MSARESTSTLAGESPTRISRWPTVVSTRSSIAGSGSSWMAMSNDAMARRRSRKPSARICRLSPMPARIRNAPRASERVVNPLAIAVIRAETTAPLASPRLVMTPRTACASRCDGRPMVSVRQLAVATIHTATAGIQLHLDMRAISECARSEVSGIRPRPTCRNSRSPATCRSAIRCGSGRC